MTLPGYDAEFIGDSQFTFHDVIEKRYFSLKLDSVAQGDKKTPADGYKAVIDSGTSVIVGPSELVDPMIEGITVNEDCSNINDLPNLTWTIDGIDYTLTSYDYVLQVTDGDERACVLGI